MKKLLRTHITIFWVFLNLMIHFPASGQVSEPKLKGIWLDYFAKFIEWPDQSHDYFLIQVLGEGEINNHLMELYKSRKIKDYPVKIEFISHVREIRQCHILFVNGEAVSKVDSVLNIVQTKPILTVGDTSGFGKKGIIINFYKEKDKIRFEFNVSAAESTGLVVDFRLLDTAKIIKKG